MLSKAGNVLGFIDPCLKIDTHASSKIGREYMPLVFEVVSART